MKYRVIGPSATRPGAGRLPPCIAVAESNRDRHRYNIVANHPPIETARSLPKGLGPTERRISVTALSDPSVLRWQL